MTPINCQLISDKENRPLKPFEKKEAQQRYVISNRTDALVYIAAHELRHLWQAARLRDDRRSANLAMAHGARGKFSEIDTEAFAIHTLREYRHRIQS